MTSKKPTTLRSTRAALWIAGLLPLAGGVACSRKAESPASATADPRIVVSGIL